MSTPKNYFSALMIWLSIMMFYCYQYILRVIPNIIMPELMSQFNVGAAEFGAFAAIYYIGYVAVHIPVGLALSRFGGKLVLPVCILLTACGLTPLQWTNSWQLVLTGRLLIGVGSSAATVGALQIFRMISPAHFSKMLGLMLSFGLMIAVYASDPLAQVVNIIGMNTAVNILIFTGIGLAFLSFLSIPNTTSQATNTSSVWQDIKTVIGNYKLLLISTLAGLMVGPLEGFADAWGSGFLKAVYAIEGGVASNIISTILTGMGIGCIALPYIADKTNLYYGITLISSVVMAVCFVPLMLAYGTPDIIKILCLLIGIFCAYQVVIIAKIATYVPEHLSGMAAAAANMIIMSFGPIFHIVIAKVIDNAADKVVTNGNNIYPAEAYIKSVLVIPSALLIAVIGFSAVIIALRLKSAKL